MSRLDNTPTPATSTRTTANTPQAPTTLTPDPGATGVSRSTKLGLLCLPLSLVALGAGAYVMTRVVGEIEIGTDPAGFQSAITSQSGEWTMFGVLMLAGALLTMAWVPAIWRLASSHTSRWAWAAAVLGTLSALGQFVHLMSWVVLSSAISEALEPASAAALLAAIEHDWLFAAIFAPYLIGFALAAPAAATALRRADLLPKWAPVLVALVSAAGLILGNITMPMMAIHPIGLLIGFAPAILRVLRQPTV